MTRDRFDRNGLRLQVYAGREPLTGRERWLSRPAPGKGRPALKRARQVEPEPIIRVAAGHHRGSRTKAVAEPIDTVVGGMPERPADLANHHRRVPG